ncbi:MAG: T9SS type A sorting domain-containing protein [Rhodothermales bacterium]|nr:T9SS type A sorting domain-containing protein [Rhodothermales bacterium]
MSSQPHDLPQRRRISRLVILCITILLATATAIASAAQTVPDKGTEAAFEFATWNIEQFGNTGGGPSNEARQLTNAATIIRESQIDLWAVQEIADESAFNDLVNEVGAGYEGRLAPTPSSLRVGYIFKSDIVSALSVQEILTQFDSDFAGRPPFLLRARISLPDTAMTVTFITIHMKAFDDQSSYERRVRASGYLKNHIDFSSLFDDPVVILGDYNDLLEGSIRGGLPSPYANFVSDEAGYLTVTRTFHDDNTNTWCGNDNSCRSGSPIDHIVITNEVFPVFKSGSQAPLNELLSDPAYVFTTSDHLPVMGRLARPSPVGIDVPAVPRRGSQETALYPNPVHSGGQLTLRADDPVALLIEVFDVLGRRRYARLSLQSGGTHILPTDELGSGVYFVRTTSSSGTSHVLKLIVTR